MKDKIVFVVEGKNDFAKLKSVLPFADIITTNGSEISNSTLNEIRRLSESKRIVLLLDPDGPGEKIRRRIVDIVPESEHVYVRKELAISSNKKKVGVEHLSNEDLLDALNYVKMPRKSSGVQLNDLFDLGLVGRENSKQLRQRVCDELGIGTANAKTLLYKINMFGFNVENIRNIVDRVKL
ncbi:ribonuclease M5 [Mycoplasmatota bacterium WC44]